MIKFLSRNKYYVISIICLLLFIENTICCLFDGITGWKPKVENNNSVDYEALRDNLSDWYFLFFMTEQTINMFLIVGVFCCRLYRSNTYKTIFFCTISYLIFNFFAMTQFKWKTISQLYASFKTLMVHLVIPTLSILILSWIRKDIVLSWKWMFICSFYLTIFYIAQISVYYSVTYVDKDGILTHLKVYNFLDFNVKVMCFPTRNIFLRYFFNIWLIIYTPLASMVIFMIYKFIFNVQIEWFPFPITKEDKLKIHNIYVKHVVSNYKETKK